MPATTLSDSLRSKVSDRKTLSIDHARSFVDRVFGADMHALRVLSLANGVIGVLHAAILSIHAIGQAYALTAKITAKSGVKQIDRLLSNRGISLDVVLKQWVRFVVGENVAIVIALDWTDVDTDDQTTLCAYMVTTHGRATPLAWKTVKKSELRDQRTAHELAMVERLHAWLPENVAITLLADRAFGYQELYALLESFGWDFVIRFRGCILVESDGGEVRTAEEWVPLNGRPKMLLDARVTADRALVGAVVFVKAKNRKESWCLATSLSDAKASEIVGLYGRRFTIEETFRDTKDLHFGMGLSATHIHDADRRDRLLLLVAIGYSLLTLLGAASEDSGLDRYLKVNTVKRRTHSLYRQGLYWYHAIPTMREDWLRRLMISFDRIVREHAFFSVFFGGK
jgi:hypothetical protein